MNGPGRAPQATILDAEGELAGQLASALESEGFAVTSWTDATGVGADEAPDVIVLVERSVTRRAQTIRSLRGRCPASEVVVVAPAARGHEVRSAVEAGAAGFVFAEEVAATLGLAARAAAAGQVSVPRRERRQVQRPSLSYREKQILGLVVMGYMNCEIASTLFLAESTVKSHLSSAFAKLGVRSRNEAVDLILDGEDGLGRGILAITGAPGAVPSTSAA